jgi:hypothetical protein
MAAGGGAGSELGFRATIRVRQAERTAETLSFLQGLGLASGQYVKLNQSVQIVTFSLATNPLSTLPLIVGNWRSAPSLNTLSVASEIWARFDTLAS